MKLTRDGQHSEVVAKAWEKLVPFSTSRLWTLAILLKDCESWSSVRIKRMLGFETSRTSAIQLVMSNARILASTIDANRLNLLPNRFPWWPSSDLISGSSDLCGYDSHLPKTSLPEEARAE
jgi:hypothetical protein